MKIKFKCGCWFRLWLDKGIERAGLACCQKHEAPFQKLEKLGLIEIDDVIYEDSRIVLFQCPPKCSVGEHKWDGPQWNSDDGRQGSVTCSKCGIHAIDEDMFL